MAGNLQADNNGNILVEFDYNNIIIVDPNKTIDAEGNISERLLDHENLVMFANLEAEVLPRTKLAVGISPDDSITTISVAKVNFLKPTQSNFFGTGYYDELTGENTTSQKGVNQPLELGIIPKNGNKPYAKNTVVNEQNIIDNGLLGITSINVRTSTSFIPQVLIELEDVQGKALFQLGNNSPYAAFFNLPYPPFYLTMKGYYGQAIRYQLNLETFSARFNSFSGNYQISLKFLGFKFNILNEISMAHLLAAPHMYSTTYSQTQSVTTGDSSGQAKASATEPNVAQGTTSSNNISSSIVSERGYQKVVEVYSEYKSKLLIPPDFPELTLVQLMNKIQNFINSITNSYVKVDVEPLTNIRNYKNILKNYFERVRGSNTSWFKEYMDPKPIILNNGERVYFFKQISREKKLNAKEELEKSIIEVFNQNLAENPTLGKNGTSPITNKITYDNFQIKFDSSEIDLTSTVREQTGIVSPTTTQIKDAITKLLQTVNVKDFEVEFVNGIALPKELILPDFFIFEGSQRFEGLISSMGAQADKKLSQVEQKLTLELASKIEDKTTGIGFKPTVRNITAVIMASAEAFIRLLDDVHTNSWNQKYNPVRKSTILDNPSSKAGTDSKGDVKVNPETLNGDNQYSSSQKPVYPWPQFFVETPEDKKGRFQIRYIADPTVVDRTQGYNYVAWPEVEFVEEYIKGLTQKLNPPIAQPPTDTESTTIITNINAIEFPNSGIAYVNKEQLKFFYEIWERQFLTSFYSGFIRATNNDQQIQDLTELNTNVEGSNIVNSLGVSSPFLALALKEYKFTSQNYEEYLKNFSNQGTGRSYQDFIRDFFVTPYIRRITEDSFNILDLNDLGRNPENLDSEYIKKLEKIVKQTINEPFIVDTIPFTDYNWNEKNLSSSNLSVNQQVYNTNQVLKVLESRSVISNFTDIYNYTENRPVTNFSYLKVTNPIELINSSYDLSLFYETREATNFIPTEGYIDQTVPSRLLPPRQTTSILNTPYFVNSILNGVLSWRRKDPHPYIQSAYLFVNSLPLATLRERYKSYDSNVTTDLDYIASCFKKFGAIHKVPYAWVLKIGSIWHRYKKYKESNIDILSGAWSNFDYITNYDPITKSPTKEYSFEYKNNGVLESDKIILQSETETDIKIQTGFYPKVINDFNVFYNGYDLYFTYSNEEIQKSVNNGLVPYALSQINGTQKNKEFAIQGYSVLLKDQIDDTFSSNDLCPPTNNTEGLEYFIIPSLGSKINQTESECLVADNTVVDVTDNQSMYNGSVRLLWAAPNYGYFDNSEISKPTPESYLTKIESETGISQSPLHFFIENKYSNIEEIFSIFDSTILNKFENEFLNFSKPITDIELGIETSSFYQSTSDINANFKNFQALFRNLMKVQGNLDNTPFQNFFQNSINNQISEFSNKIKNFLQYDVLLKYGNPTNYKRRVFDSYLGDVVDPIDFGIYTPNSLPSSQGGITLTQSKARYPQEWKTLEVEVGFSTIPGIIYSDKGSFITDFFIDNNISFTVNNISLLSPIIKMYATQKYKNNKLNSSQFKTQLREYTTRGTKLQDVFLNGVLNDIRSKIEDTQPLPERTIQSVVDGQQSKIETYEVFKALNDKWIAGSDFKNKTLFEDILFLDRASRNIGDTMVLDIFDLQNMINTNAMNEKMSVFTFLGGILIKNNFVVMPLPSYTNFYRVQDVDGITTPNSEGSLEFANNMWGTFLNVDYTKSGPKMLAIYAGKPSEIVDTPKGNPYYRDDSFEMRRASENPLIENQQGKKDWAISNKCVGFNVDIGTRNQNVFYNFQVSQDTGKATSEAIQALLQMIEQSNGRDITTQNVGLYNFYKNRSYQCTVQCLGNALLQPMMYFNLRHVPMFYGPYMITDVIHTITPGNFETTITGVRQSAFDLPVLDSFLQSINKNLLTKLEALVVTKKDQVATTTKASPNSKKAATTVQKGGSEKATPNSCINKLDPAYERFEVVNAIPNEPLSPEQLKNEIIKHVSDPILQAIIFAICYVRTYSETNKAFMGFGNNFATLELTQNYASRSDYFSKQCSCLEIKTTSSKQPNSQPVAIFSSIDKFIQFMRDSLANNKERILGPTMGLTKYYVCWWPQQAISETYYDNNKKEFELVNDTLEKGLLLARSVGLAGLTRTGQIVGEAASTSTNTTQTTSQTNTQANPCPPPIIDSFSPTAATANNIMTIRGKFLDQTTGVTINNVQVTTGLVKNLDGTRVTVVIPKSDVIIPTLNPIIVSTLYGTTTSKNNFLYKP